MLENYIKLFIPDTLHIEVSRFGKAQVRSWELHTAVKLLIIRYCLIDCQKRFTKNLNRDETNLIEDV
jgi:hypothetical protein